MISILIRVKQLPATGKMIFDLAAQAECPTSEAEQQLALRVCEAVADEFNKFASEVSKNWQCGTATDAAAQKRLRELHDASIEKERRAKKLASRRSPLPPSST